MLICVLAQSPAADNVPLIQPLPSDPALKQQREARNRSFNLPDVNGRPLDEQPGNVPPPATIVNVPAKPEMPVVFSDLVVLGRVMDAQPFLSEDRKAIYTDYTFLIADVLKNSVQPVRTGQTISVLRIGGEGRIPDNRIVRYDVHGRGEPLAAGQQYLLFLRYHASLAAYKNYKTWQVKNGRLSAVSPDDLWRVSQHASRFDGSRVEDVLAQLKTMAATQTDRVNSGTGP